MKGRNLYAVAVAEAKTGRMTLIAGTGGGVLVFASMDDATKHVRDVFGPPARHENLSFHVVSVGSVVADLDA